MAAKEIINQILSMRSELSKKKIMGMIEEKKKNASNLLTTETAARIVAAELGIRNYKKSPLLKMQIQDLMSGFNDVTISGQIISIYPTKIFTRRNWTEGRLAKILISDETGRLMVVLWDNNVELLEEGKIHPNQKIRISHGYVREGIDGKLELHIGEKGKIRIIGKENVN
jgi:replication factor A1